MTTARDFLKGSRMSRFPNAAFEKVGDTVTGTIVGVPRVVDGQFGPALVVDLANPAYADGGITVWIKQGQQGEVVAEACHDELVEGGKLTLTLVELKDTGKGNPAKIYSAAYEAPQARVDVSTIFGNRA